MLKTMRESFHHLKWTLFAVILVFILGFVFFSGSGSGARDVTGSVVARVGGENIGAVEFERRYRAELDRQQSNYQGKLTPELIKAIDLPRQVLEAMIERLLRLDAARRLRLSVSDEEVAVAVTAVPGLQENGAFIGNEKYEKLLRSNGYTPERFEEEIREGLLLDKYSALVKASVLVPDSEIQREFSSKNEKASIEYIKIPASRLASNVPATDLELKSYFEKNKERYRLPEQRRIKYLLIDRAKVRAKTVVADSESKAEYERRKSSFAVPEQVTASHILIKIDSAKGPAGEAEAKAKSEAIAQRAKQGEDFAKLADQTTEDPSGKGSGGALPPFSRGQMVPEFEQAAFDMAPGEIRGPVKSQFGYHIIKLVSKAPPRTKTFDEVRPQIDAELAERRAAAETDRRAKEISEKLKNRKKASDDDLRKLQDDVVTYDTAPWASRSDPITGIGANQRFSDEAWNTRVGEISTTPITTSRGPAFVKPIEQRAAGLPPLDEIRNRVAADYEAARREKEALAKLQADAKELASGATLVALSKRYETEVKTTPDFAPGGPIPDLGNAPELSAAVFATAKAQAGPPAAVPGGFVLFRVIDRTGGDPKAFDTQRAELADTIRAREAERLLRASIQQLRIDRKVTVNEELLKSFLPEENARRG